MDVNERQEPTTGASNETASPAISTVQEAREYLAENHIDNIRLVVTDLMGMARGKRVPVAKFLKACEQGLTYCLAHYGFTIDSDMVPDLPGLGWAGGFPDAVMWPDLGTLIALPWDEGSAWVVCDMRYQDGEEVPYDPRNVLKRQIAALSESGAALVAGLEYECYVLRETQQSLRAKMWDAGQFEGLFTGGACYDQVRTGVAGPLMKDIWRNLCRVGVPLDSFHIELGGGHVEFPMKEAETLAAADRAILLKVAIKEICQQHGLMATFMAKIDPSYEGLSGAVHHSLVDASGDNLFYDAARPHTLSVVFDQWCEGLLQNLVDMTLMLLPNYNSYKRPVPGSYVGNSTTWGIENRVTSFRAINFDPHAVRIEARLAAADANPYLALAATIAGGTYGLRNRLALRPLFSGTDPAVDDQGRDDVQRIPPSLEAAITQFEGSERMREFFGDSFCEMFVAHRRNELDWFRHRVSDLERARYLEYV
jgi:glutamine synthetase